MRGLGRQIPSRILICSPVHPHVWMERLVKLVYTSSSFQYQTSASIVCSRGVRGLHFCVCIGDILLIRLLHRQDAKTRIMPFDSLSSLAVQSSGEGLSTVHILMHTLKLVQLIVGEEKQKAFSIAAATNEAVLRATRSLASAPLHLCDSATTLGTCGPSSSHPSCN